MNNEQLLNALGNLLLNNTNKGITLNLAYQNFINISKNRCRTDTIIYYEKKWNVLKDILQNLNYNLTSEITKNSYNQIINILKLKGYKNITVNKYMDLLKQIMKVNYELELIPNNPIANIKKLHEDIPDIETISEKNILNILEYIENLKPNFINVRNKLIIYLLNDTGARVNEIVNIELKNVKIDLKAVYLSFTKTKDTRWVFLQEKTIETLKSYLKWHNGNKYLLLNANGTQIKRDSIYHFLEQIKKDININQSITPHKWRHTFATKLVRNNVNLNTIMDVLGHTQYETTKRYIHIEMEEKRNEILNILENKKKDV